MPEITLQQAQAALDAAGEKARQLGVAVNIAVVDSGANLMAFARMDGALIGSVDVAIKKARTASLFAMESGALGPLSQPGAALYGIELTNGGLVTFHGGVPMMAGDALIGAIGSSGSTVENDRAIAQTGAAALGG